LDSKLFAKFCASENSLEIYVSLLCVMAYRKESSYARLAAFSEAFLGDDSPMQINTNGGKATFVKNCLIVGSETSDIVEKRIKTALDPMLKDVLLNFNDTYTRYINQVTSNNAKYDYFRVKFPFGKVNKFAYRHKSKYKEYIKVLSDAKSSGFNVKSALDILGSGGYPTRKMGLGGVVAGM
jgi:hypothetical protein